MLSQDFQLKPSKYYLAFLFVTILASLVIIFVIALDVRIKIGLLMLTAGYGAYIIWQYGLLRAQRSILQIKHIDQRKWVIKTNAQTFETELNHDSTVTGVVSVLRFKLPQKRLVMSCIVFPDSLATGQYRALMRVVLAL